MRLIHLISSPDFFKERVGDHPIRVIGAPSRFSLEDGSLARVEIVDGVIEVEMPGWGTTYEMESAHLILEKLSELWPAAGSVDTNLS